jgi:PilZ domain
MDESSKSQNRRSRRSNVLMAASIETAGSSTDVRMRNLSAEGVLVEGDFLPIEGTQVLFRRNDLLARGSVAWVQGNRAGIAFDTKLDPETVLRHIPTPRPRKPLDFKRPGFANHALKPHERKIGEDWIWGKPLPSPGD